MTQPAPPDLCPHCKTPIPSTPPGTLPSCPRCGNQKGNRKKRDLVAPILGKLAIDHRLITKEQLQEAISALRQENETDPDVSLEDVLLSRGFIPAGQMQKLVVTTLRELDKQFCETAKEMGILTSSETEVGLGAQAKIFQSGELRAVSDILMDTGLLTATQRDRILDRMRGASTKPAFAPAPSLTEIFAEQDRKQRLTASAKEIPPQEMAVAKMAMQYHFITSEQLETAISAWHKARAEGSPAPLGDIFVRLHMIDTKRLHLLHATRLFHETRRLDQIFGRLAILHKFTDETAIERALSVQLIKFKRSKTVKPIGRILVETGTLTHQQVTLLLTEQKRISPARKKPEAPSAPPSPPSDPAPPAELIVEVATDAMSAYILPIRFLPKGTDLSRIHTRIRESGVAFGILPDATLAAYLTDPGLWNAPFIVAEGLAVTPPEDGRIRYGFDIAYLKAGRVDPDGAIDYFDRGEVPYVKEGDLLGERVPPTPGSPGRNVHGVELSCPDPKDVELRAGPGTILSEDAQRIHAQIQGQPHATLGGKISVFEEMEIPGNVDLKTGHVKFTGAVRIRGNVEPGFLVKAASVAVTDISEAEIHVEGDLVAKGGIIGAKIHAGGAVFAKYIVDSEITAFGDIVVEKEILGSNIRSSGTIAVPKGKLLATEASARGGMEIREVGSEVSAPCRLAIGVDAHVNAVTKTLQEKSDGLKTRLEKSQKAILKGEKRQVLLHQKIAENAQVQDQTQLEIRTLKECIPDPKNPPLPVVEQIRKLSAMAEKAEQDVDLLFTEQDQILETVLENRREAETLITSIEEVQHEQAALIEWAKERPGKPVLVVRSSIAPGTHLSGPHAQMLIKEGKKSGVFSEVQITDYRGEPSWVIRMQT